MVGMKPHNRTAVVTGAASGIGRVLVTALAERGARHIVAVDRDLDGVTRTAQRVADVIGARVEAIALDVSSVGQIEAVIDQVEETVGPIDMWFSNAGVNPEPGLGGEPAWEAALDVNLLAHVRTARRLIPLMEQRGHGAFVVTASAAGLLTDVNAAPYAASKHAAVGFTEWLAVRHGERLTISCVCPQGVHTGMTKSSSLVSAGPNFLEPSIVAEAILDAVAEGRLLVLPHSEVATYESRRSEDRQRWVEGVRRRWYRRADSPDAAS